MLPVIDRSYRFSNEDDDPSSSPFADFLRAFLDAFHIEAQTPEFSCWIPLFLRIQFSFPLVFLAPFWNFWLPLLAGTKPPSQVYPFWRIFPLIFSFFPPPTGLVCFLANYMLPSSFGARLLLECLDAVFFL